MNVKYLTCGVVLDEPWKALGSGPADLVPVHEIRAVAIACEPAALRFVFRPEPTKHAFTNEVTALANTGRRLYVSYGDQVGNDGPVQIVQFSPEIAEPLVELHNVPEEALAPFATGSGDRIFVGGGDPRESENLGNVYFHDLLGWHKLRTLPSGLHVDLALVEDGGRLYCAYSSDSHLHPKLYLPVSRDAGVSWKAEVVDPTRSSAGSTPGVVRATHGGAIYVYALETTWTPELAFRLYRRNAGLWQEVALDDVQGRQLEWFSAANFGDNLLVSGWRRPLQPFYFDEDFSRETLAVSLKGTITVPFLHDTECGRLCTVHEGRLYYTRNTSEFLVMPDQMVPTLHQLSKLSVTDEHNLGPIALPGGTRLRCMAWCLGRFYVGIGPKVPRWNGVVGYPIVLAAIKNFPLEDATLEWNAVMPEGGAVRIQLASMAAPEPSQTEIIPAFEVFFGPDGTSNTFYETSGTPLSAKHASHPTWQARIEKTPGTNGALPHIAWIRMRRGDGTTLTLSLDEGTGVYAGANRAVDVIYESRVFRLPPGKPIEGGHLYVRRTLPSKTSVQVQVRTGATKAAILHATWRGPSGTMETWYDGPDACLWEGHSGHHWVQYRARLHSSDDVRSPFLHQVQIISQLGELAGIQVTSAKGSPWIAGTARALTVVVVGGNGLPLALGGRIPVQAFRADDGTPVPIEPESLDIVNGVGTRLFRLKHAVPTIIRASAAGTGGETTVMDVVPGPVKRLTVRIQVPSALPNTPPAVPRGQPFTISVIPTDIFGNIAREYTGIIKAALVLGGPAAASSTTIRIADPALAVPQWTDQYAFHLDDKGQKDLLARFDEIPPAPSAWSPGEWNLLCRDSSDSRIAGAAAAVIT